MSYLDPSLKDPALLGWPSTLPIELALGESSVKEIFQAYGMTKADYLRLSADEGFLAQIEQYKEALKTDGMSFRLKAQLQAEELLKQSWRMIHADDVSVPPTVKADLIKSTMKWAGLDASANKAAQVGAVAPALQINIQFHGKRREIEPPTIEATNAENS